MSIVKNFDNLVTAIEKLKSELTQGEFQFWSNGSEHESDLNYVLNALGDYWYQDGRDGRETNSYYAAIAVNRSCLLQLEHINQLKLMLKKDFSQIRKNSDIQLETTKYQLTSRNPVLAKLMESEGLSRLHLKQLTRVIPVLEHSPEVLSFNWYQSGRSIQKVSKEQVLKQLLKLDHSSTTFQIQFQKLATLGDKEPLAIVQQQAPLMRLNSKSKNGIRKAQNIAMPVFFLDDSEFPKITPPPIECPPTRARKTRSDNRLEDSAFLPALRVFRYQNK